MPTAASIAAPSEEVSYVCGLRMGMLKTSAVICIDWLLCEPPPDTMILFTGILVLFTVLSQALLQ